MREVATDPLELKNIDIFPILGATSRTLSSALIANGHSSPMEVEAPTTNQHINQTHINSTSNTNSIVASPTHERPAFAEPTFVYSKLSHVQGAWHLPPRESPPGGGGPQNFAEIYAPNV